MRVTVTGATGFLGGRLARRLVGEGHEVAGLGRDERAGAALAADGVGFHRVDLARTSPEDPVLDADAIVHCAALSTLWGPWADFQRANVQVSAMLARAAALRGARLVHISSPSIYNATGLTRDIGEETVPTSFESSYARSKWLAEQQVHAIAPSALVLRPRGIYGPGDRSIMPRVARIVGSGRMPRLSRGEVWTQLTHVDNVVEAIVLGLGSKLSGPVNVTDDRTIGLWATLDRVADALGVPRPHGHLPPRLAEGAAAVAERVCRVLPGRPEPPVTVASLRLITRGMTLDLRRARDELGYRPVVGAEGLDAVIEALGKGRA
ncbi:NAD-dependent epimerase/dehydratase family protein [Propionibacterium australiense]|uniref:NAD(P)-dependent oxidoreductase n=1 Tax=Propionibacterium australiense TaxID=119981 RepID=A0A8B3FQ93_9ACTN|nr:NAD(P)-dependent oxidoreductase [Propionibacterium australiense]RLP10187.1 NAD(P)-dependent oxidoreductase [Propionibacterium australiense]